MGKTLKWAGIGVAGLIVIIAVAVFVLLGNINDIIRAAVEQVGSEVTGTDVRLGEVDISLDEGKGTMRGFRLANPDGFTQDDAFRFDEVSVTLDVGTILDDVVVVKEVVVDGPVIVYELADQGDNMNQIKDNVQDFSSKSGGSTETSTSSGGSEKKIIIENVYLRNANVGVRHSALSDKKIDVDMPDLHLTDIGKDSGGASPAEVAEQLLDELTGSISSFGAGLNFDELFGDVGKMADEAMKEAESVAEDAAKEVEDAASSVTDSVSEGADEALGGVKSLFGD